MIQYLLILIFAFSPSVFAVECESDYSSLVFDKKTKNILFEKRADEIIYPASLTKVMTLYLTFEALKKKQLKLSDVLVASQTAEDVSAMNKVNTLKLKEGDKMTVEQAIKASTVKSFNEASYMLAEKIGGSEWSFVKMMNKKAKELKMNHTNFRNSTGFHEDGQYTTNYDLARLTSAIQTNFPEYIKYFSAKEFSYKGTKYLSHNHVLLTYKGAYGLKTGFTNKSGFNLIASARQGDIQLNSIVTGCESYQNRDAFTKDLLNNSFKDAQKSHKEFLVKIR